MSMTILTVDDSRTMRDMLKVALTEAGYRVVQAVDGMHGLEVLAQEAPRVIITDINMPKLDGFGFIERVRENQRFLGVPILVLTTESSPEKKNVARRAGATGWIVKPFELGQTGRRRAPRGRLSAEGFFNGHDGGDPGDLFPGVRGAARRTRGRPARDG